MDSIQIKIAQNKKEINDAREIRHQVFQVEQGIDSKLDFDGKDDKSEHVIAYSENKAVGAARIRYISNKTAKLERLAVLKSYRKNGIGRKIVNYVTEYIKKRGIENMTLDSQEHARKFYEEIGFKQKGKVFWEVNIPHVKMWKKI
ncbi:MAG: GNAT family N-acetyltransferase [Candidatus Paceibacterota bacterium]|jgi:predicted GNAT family N-acyltransferase